MIYWLKARGKDNGLGKGEKMPISRAGAALGVAAMLAGGAGAAPACST